MPSDLGPRWVGPCPAHQYYEMVSALTIEWLDDEDVAVRTGLDTEGIDATPPYPSPEGVVLDCGEEIPFDELGNVTDEWDDPVDPSAFKGEDGEWYTTIREGSDGSGRWA